MNGKPTETLADSDRSALFISWLRSVTPARSPKETIVTKVAPWRRHFTDAIAAGYSWRQLAKQVAPKPEIGIKTSAAHLKKCVRKAFIDAGESMPEEPKKKIRRRARKQSDRVVKNAATTTGNSSKAPP